MFWGLTPALDLLDEYKSVREETPDTINILILGGTDCRHILKTLSKRHRHKKTKINFYLLEACVETIARQLLLLNIALQPRASIGHNQKAKIFMELYGNTLIRTSVAQFLASAAADLVKMVTDYNYLKDRMNCVNIDIKYKDRDYLENLLKFWCGKDDFNIIESWDKRLRQQLGVRYDSRMGSFDWDLHMRFHPVGGNQVCNQEYKNFRTNGVAFSWLESEVSKPNRTMVCALFPVGEKYAHHGYLGDMKTGPFVTFGLDCEDKDFLKSQHGQNTYRATDVTERNLKQIFHELEFQEDYEHQKTSDIQLGAAVLKQDKLIVDIKAVEIVPKCTKKCMELEDVTINFWSMAFFDTIKFKEKFKGTFDILYFGSMYMKFFKKEIVASIAKNDSLLIIENQRYVVTHRNKDLENFGEEVKGYLKEMSAKTVSFNVLEDDHIKYILSK